MRVGRILSIVGHPFLLLPTSVFLATYQDDATTRARMFVPIVLALASIALYIVWKLKKGDVSNVDVSDRTQRGGIYFAPILCMVVLYLVLNYLVGNTHAARGVAAALALLISHALANPWIKASLHTSFVVLAAAYLLPGRPMLAALFVGLALLIAWGRVAYQRHSVREVVVGFAFGVLAAAAYCFL